MGSAALDGPSMGEPKLREKTWEPAYEEDVLKSWRAEPDLYRFAPERGQPTYVIDTPAVSERLMARRRRDGVCDHRHDRPGAAHARTRRALPVRPRPERNQHRAHGRAEDGQGAPPL